MKLTIQEYQAFIDKKEWYELSNTDIFALYNSTLRSEWKKLSISKDMILDFILEKSKVISAMSTNTSNISEPNVIKNIFLQIQLQLDLTIDDWKEIQTKAMELIDSGVFTYESTIQDIIGAHNKNAEYLRLMMNDTWYKKLSERFKLYTSQPMKPDMFNDLTPEELIEFNLERLGFGEDYTVHLKDQDQKELLKFFKSGKEASLYNFKTFSYIDPGRVLAEVPVNEFEEILREYIENNRAISEITSWYQENKDVGIPDDLLKLILGTDSHSHNDFIQNLSADQIRDNANHFAAGTIVKSEKFTLKEIIEMKPGLKTQKLHTFNWSGFYTEEEIREFPHLFDPEYLKNSTNFFITKDTFRLLNKAWGKRQRYNSELTDFHSIFRRMDDQFRNIKNLRYLQEKCQLSDAEMAKIASDSNFSMVSNKSKDYKTLRIIDSFFKNTRE